MLIQRLLAAVEPMFVKQRQSNIDIRLSTSQPFFYQISTLKQRRVPGGYSVTYMQVKNPSTPPVKHPLPS
jgi:hypothetical protein